MTQAAATKIVFLTGYMGAGKTTIGRLLAQRMGRVFYDLDDLIFQQTGLTPSEIFTQTDEGRFRQYEHDALAWILTRSGTTPCIVALGGGTLTGAESNALLQECGFPQVYLHANTSELYTRCHRQRDVLRPLLDDEQRFRDRFKQRESGYRAAALTIRTDGKDPEQIVNEILQSLQPNLVEAP